MKSCLIKVFMKTIFEHRIITIVFLLVSTLTWFPSQGRSDSILILDPETSKYPLGSFIDILEDKDRNLSIQQITSSTQSNFQRNKKPVINLGYTDSVYWIRITLKNNSVQDHWLLEYGKPHMDSIELYIPQEQNGFLIKKTGDIVPFAQREVLHQNLLFHLILERHKTHTLYLRFQTSGSMALPLTLWSEIRFAEKDHIEQLVLGLYYGLISVMILYNLFLYLSLRDNSYLYYILYVTSLGLGLSVSNGISYEYLWPSFPWWQNVAMIFFISMGNFWIIVFARHFLGTKEYSPRLDRVLQLLLLLAGFLVIAAFFISNRTYANLAGLQVLTLLSIMGASYLSMRGGNRSARFFFIAFTLSFLNLIIMPFRIMGYIPENFFTLHGLQIASALEVILLSLALGDRINLLRREREQAQAEVLENKQVMVEALQKSDRLKDEFLTNTTHELQTPLTGIIGLTESILGGVGGTLSDKQARDLSLILKSGRRLSDLIGDITDHARLKYHDLKLDLQPTDLRSVVEVVLTLLRPILEQKPLAVINQLPDSLPFVLADENRLQQIFLNLISNAIHFTPEGKICLSAEVKDGLITISVSDTGIGIPEDSLEYIFHPFRQVDTASNQVPEGLGLGLAITKQLVELHGGTIQAVSKPGEGSEFSFSIPVTDEKLINEENAKTAALTETQSKIRLDWTEDMTTTVSDVDASVQPAEKKQDKTILIVDDDAVMLEMLKNHLATQDYRFISAGNGADALDILKTNEFDLVIVDLMMPGMNGFEVCQAIRQSISAVGLPIIIMSVKNRVSDLVEGINCGANDYITKPFFRDELLARIQLHISMKDAQVALSSSEIRYRSLFENVTDVIFTLSNIGAFTSLNTAFEHLTGWKKEEWLGKYFEGIVFPEDLPRALELQKNVLSGEATTIQELRIKKKQGDYLVGEFKVSPHILEGKAVGLLGVGRDITEKKALQMDAMRKSQLASLGELAAGVAHEVNNPINSIINYAQLMLKNSDATPDHSEFADRIKKEGKRIADIVGSLLSFARVRKDRKIPFTVEHIISETLNLTSAQIRKEGIRFELDASSQLPSILCNPQQIQQVFLNLINNARNSLNQKYPSKDKDKILKITLETNQTEGNSDSLRITFFDQGTGIPPSLIKDVMKPFITTRSEIGGTGLGLSISDDIIANHGGKLKIDSVEGEYTRVIVDLPFIN